MIGNGTGTQIAVLGTIAALILMLCALTVLGIERNYRWLAEKIGIATVPPADPTQAFAKLRGNVGAFFGPESYPADARDAGAQGRVVAALVVAPTGRVDDCRIIQSSGHRSLDAQTCSIVVDRVRFSPARDGQGRAIESKYDLAVRWELPEQ